VEVVPDEPDEGGAEFAPVGRLARPDSPEVVALDAEVVALDEGGAVALTATTTLALDSGAATVPPAVAWETAT
jgi:hypothetical protein